MNELKEGMLFLLLMSSSVYAGQENDGKKYDDGMDRIPEHCIDFAGFAALTMQSNVGKPILDDLQKFFVTHDNKPTQPLPKDTPA